MDLNYGTRQSIIFAKTKIKKNTTDAYALKNKLKRKLFWSRPRKAKQKVQTNWYCCRLNKSSSPLTRTAPDHKPRNQNQTGYSSPKVMTPSPTDLVVNVYATAGDFSPDTKMSATPQQVLITSLFSPLKDITCSKIIALKLFFNNMKELPDWFTQRLFKIVHRVNNTSENPWDNIISCLMDYYKRGSKLY